MSDEHEWIEVMDDMAGGPMVYKSEADEAIATLTAERDALVEAVRLAMASWQQPDLEMRANALQALFALAQLREQDDE